MRLFLAVELPGNVRRHLIDVQSAIKDVAQAAWTKAENLHLTLKFLGETPDSALAGLCAAIGRVRARGAMSLRFDHVLCFPPRGSIRIIGAGAADPPPALGALVEDLETACEEKGFARENRRYAPHITLARARRPLPGPLRERIAAAAAARWPSPPMEISRFVLMESRLKPAGAEYAALAAFDL